MKKCYSVFDVINSFETDSDLISNKHTFAYYIDPLTTTQALRWFITNIINVTGSQNLAIVGRLTIAAAGIVFKIILLFGHRYYIMARGGSAYFLYCRLYLYYYYIFIFVYNIIIYLFSNGVSIENGLRGNVCAIKYK